MPTKLLAASYHLTVISVGVLATNGVVLACPMQYVRAALAVVGAAGGVQLQTTTLMATLAGVLTQPAALVSVA